MVKGSVGSTSGIAQRTEDIPRLTPGEEYKSVNDPLAIIDWMTGSVHESKPSGPYLKHAVPVTLKFELQLLAWECSKNLLECGSLS